MGLFLQRLLRYADEGEGMLNPNKRMLQCNGNIPVYFQPKVEGHAISWEGYAYHVLGFSGSAVSPFSEAW
jgi:hypothetical protein